MSLPYGSLIERRQLCCALALGAMTRVAPVQAQTTTEAALEARAPAMPALGTHLNVPDITLLDGTRFQAGSGAPWQSQKSRGMKMLALSIDKTAEDARAYMQRRGYTFPAAWASPNWRRQFAKPKGLPITWLLDGQRHLVLAEKGQMFPEDVEAIGQLI